MKLHRRLRETWETLNKSIYTGARLEANLRALTYAGSFFAVIGLALLILDIATRNYPMAIAAFMTSAFGGACAFFAKVKKRRDIAILMPTIFCAAAFSIYTVIGAGEGSAMLWSFTVPIGICYFVSVKHGILLSLYYAVFFLIFFYSPVGSEVKANYTPSFISRFPLIYSITAIFTFASMVQYHRGILLENEYAQRLHDEVEKQTRLATERADRLEELSDEVVETLAVTIDAKDRYTNGHSFRVSLYSVALARRLGWSEEEIHELEREALLHDIGKIGVPDPILNKPGKLTKEEFAVIQSHTTTGGSILSQSEELLGASGVARHHHERYDGRGYPDGLSGESIPLHARVVSIADAFDAMRSDRIYRKGLPLDVIREELIKGRGKQFDPRLLDVFLPLLDSGELEEIAHRESLMHMIPRIPNPSAASAAPAAPSASPAS